VISGHCAGDRYSRGSPDGAGSYSGRSPDGAGSYSGSSSVLADRLDRAFLEGCQTSGLFFRSGRLMEDVAAATVIIPLEIAGCGLAAKVAVDASGVDVESAGDILGYSTAQVSHLRGMSRGWSEGPAPEFQADPLLISVLGSKRSTQEAVRKPPLGGAKVFLDSLRARQVPHKTTASPGFDRALLRPGSSRVDRRWNGGFDRSRGSRTRPRRPASSRSLAPRFAGPVPWRP
jgi:hypothetical protein